MDASSPFLNKPIRSEERVRAEKLSAEAERNRRLGRSEPQLQDILDGANQTIYYPDGRVVEIKSKDAP